MEDKETRRKIQARLFESHLEGGSKIVMCGEWREGSGWERGGREECRGPIRCGERQEKRPEVHQNDL